MRSIVVGIEDCESSRLTSRNSCGLSDYQRMSGDEAYEFLLAVICGLHSPLLGETEILGQFREFIKRSEGQVVSRLREVFDALVIDAKRIRTSHLQKIGSNSYGSLIRRNLSSTHASIHFIGAGQLVEEILPWLQKKPFAVQLYTRNPDKHSGLQEQFKSIELATLDQAGETSCEALVIAAPLPAVQLQKLIAQKKPHIVFDLRGESQSDPLQHQNIFPLHQLFADIETNQRKTKKIKEQALLAVANRTREKRLVEKPRPFGWDDLWAM